jgi:formate--tetrahydrofolate ligase
MLSAGVGGPKTLARLELAEDAGPMPTDLDIARAANPRPIEKVANDLGLPADTVQPWGPGVAKVSLAAMTRLGPPRAKYVLVTATTPTPFGEGRGDSLSSPAMRNAQLRSSPIAHRLGVI